MKYKVVRKFNDEQHRHKYEVNDIYPLPNKESREDLLMNVEKNKYDKVYIVPLDKLTKVELQELCIAHDLEYQKTDTKADLIELLSE